MLTPLRKEIPDNAACLNEVLKHTLTSINQYFLHARMLKHLGAMPEADSAYKAALDAMKHTDKLVERILALDSLPNMQELAQLSIGNTAREIAACDKARAQATLASLDAARVLCDKESQELLAAVEKSTTEYLHFLQR